MFHPSRTKSEPHLMLPTKWAGKGALTLLTLLVLVPVSQFGHPVRTLDMGAATPAFADARAASESVVSVSGVSRAPTSTAGSSGNSGSPWDAEDWAQWEAQVQNVVAPPGIQSGEPLEIDIRALDSSGHDLPNALVEVTWLLPEGQFQDTCRPNLFGVAAVKRTLGKSCQGRRCVVAVRVTQDGQWMGAAYSAFAPK
jgi:hypothetical protein